LFSGVKRKAVMKVVVAVGNGKSVNKESRVSFLEKQREGLKFETFN